LRDENAHPTGCTQKTNEDGHIKTNDGAPARGRKKNKAYVEDERRILLFVGMFL